MDPTHTKWLVVWVNMRFAATGDVLSFDQKTSTAFPFTPAVVDAENRRRAALAVHRRRR